METLSALLAICAGKSPVIDKFSAQSPVTRSFDVFCDLRLNEWWNNREAGDLRRHRADYDVTVMYWIAAETYTNGLHPSSTLTAIPNDTV